MATKEDKKIAQKNFKEWSADDVSDWLGTIGLGSSAPDFRELGIVGDVLPQLIDLINVEAIESGLNLDFSQRLKIRSAVTKLVGGVRRIKKSSKSKPWASKVAFVEIL